MEDMSSAVNTRKMLSIDSMNSVIACGFTVMIGGVSFRGMSASLVAGQWATSLMYKCEKW